MIKNIVCPKCLGELAQTPLRLLSCADCQKEYEIVEGIPVLLPDAKLKTNLEKIDYNKVHSKVHRIDGPEVNQIYAKEKKIFENYISMGGKVLEIGSGTGALTLGLSRSGDFKEVTATDVSLKFLLGVKGLLQEIPNVEYVVCDGNNPPFSDGQYDLVIGRSVLHHLIDYKTTLKRCKSILKDGGAAIFFEPVLQGKAVVAMMIDLMLHMDSSFKLKVFTKDETNKMKRLVRHQTKSAWLPFSVEKYSQMEDKYIFDINEMKELGREAGFKKVEFLNITDKIDTSYKCYLQIHLAMLDIPKKKVDAFQGIFTAFEETWGALLGSSLTTPMGYFIFQK